MKKLIVTALFTLFSTQSFANTTEIFAIGDTFYCKSDSGEMSGFATIGTTPLQEQFKFQIKAKKNTKFGEIQFGLGGVFDKLTMSIMNKSKYLEANNEIGNFFLFEGRFNFGGANMHMAYMLTGTCDKF